MQPYSPVNNHSADKRVQNYVKTYRSEEIPTLAILNAGEGQNSNFNQCLSSKISQILKEKKQKIGSLRCFDCSQDLNTIAIGTLYGAVIMHNFVSEKESMHVEEEWGSVFKVKIYQEKYILAGYLQGKIVIFDKMSLKTWKEILFSDVELTSLNLLQLNSSKISLIFSVKDSSESHKVNFLYEKEMGYFSDKDTISGLNPMIECTGSRIVQVECLQEFRYNQKHK